MTWPKTCLLKTSVAHTVTRVKQQNMFIPSWNKNSCWLKENMQDAMEQTGKHTQTDRQTETETDKRSYKTNAWLLTRLLLMEHKLGEEPENKQKKDRPILVVLILQTKFSSAVKITHFELELNSHIHVGLKTEVERTLLSRQEVVANQESNAQWRREARVL